MTSTKASPDSAWCNNHSPREAIDDSAEEFIDVDLPGESEEVGHA